MPSKVRGVAYLGSLRRPLLAGALLSAAVLAVAAAGLAGPLDPAPDDVEANTTAKTGTAADGTVDDVGLDEKHEVSVSSDEWTEVEFREEPADVDSEEGTASVGGAHGAPEEETQLPGAAAEGARKAGSVSVGASFAAQTQTGQLVGTGESASPVYLEVYHSRIVPDTRLAAGFSADNTDAAGTTEGPSLADAPTLKPYYSTGLPYEATDPPTGDDPGRSVPASGDGGGNDGPETSSGSASTQSTKTSPGLTDVVGIDNRAEAVAAAAATAIPVLGWILYHRIKGHDVLENDTRKAIYDEVCREPGLGVKELADAADVSYSTASYHLERLEEADMLVSSKRGKKLCYFQNGGTYTEDERELLKVLRNEEAMRVFMDIHEHPGTYRARIADRLDVSTTTVNWHLDGLVEAGLVHENRDGRTAHLYVDQDLIDGRVRPLLDKTAGDDDVDVPSAMTELRSRLEAPATA